jgi:hypothetical protein
VREHLSQHAGEIKSSFLIYFSAVVFFIFGGGLTRYAVRASKPPAQIHIGATS